MTDTKTMAKAVERTTHRATKGNYRWQGVEVLPYKEDDRALFKTITRQVLFSDPELTGELRYFEVAPGGFSTLERHRHMHAVLVLRGRGHCLVGSEVKRLAPHDDGPRQRGHHVTPARGDKAQSGVTSPNAARKRRCPAVSPCGERGEGHLFCLGCCRAVQRERTLGVGHGTPPVPLWHSWGEAGTATHRPRVGVTPPRARRGT